ncbi:MAG: hypothetical protein ACFFB0_04030 [Promethearchaeota archaeon]
MKNKRKMKIIILIIGIFFAVSPISKYSIIDNRQNKDNVFKFLNSVLQTAGEGEQINVSLHQTYLNISTIEFSNLSNSNVLTVLCPSEPTFNSSFTEFMINDIYVPNKTIIYEDDFRIDAISLYGKRKAVSFTIKGTGYLENASFRLYNEDDTTSGSLNLEIFKSKWANNQYEPNGLYHAIKTGYNFNNFDPGWYTFTNLHELLNISDTENNTFFISLKDTNDNTYWYFDSDYIGAGDNSDDLDCWKEDPGPEDWVLITSGVPPDTVDLTLKCDFSPLKLTPKPSDIGLKINNTAVSDNVNNSGYWMTSNQEYTNSKGELEFIISADYDWWNLSCNITKVQINYTKTGLKADSTYTILEKDLFIWNASINENITCYDARIDDYNSMIFKIPTNWSDIRAFNGSTEKLVDSSAPAINGYRDVIVFDAGNGANWFLTAKVDNRTPTPPDNDGKPADKVPLVLIIIAITSTIAGIAVATTAIFLLRKRKRAS